MKLLFLDVDGVLNSHASATFWHNKRDQSKWENEMYRDWPGTLKEYIAMELDPIALSNLEELLRRVPDLKIVVSSTWRYGETVETLKNIFHPSKLIADAIIGMTPVLRDGPRGHEIQAWLDRNDLEVDQKTPKRSRFVILDDDSDMDHLLPYLVQTDELNGFTFTDMLKAKEVLIYTGNTGE